jgi:hypothetical protein
VIFAKKEPNLRQLGAFEFIDENGGGPGVRLRKSAKEKRGREDSRHNAARAYPGFYSVLEPGGMVAGFRAPVASVPGGLDLF